MTVQEQRDALLDDLAPHASRCAWDGNEPIYGCTCGADERRERLAAVLDALIAAVRADARAPLEAEVELLREAWEHCPDRCACESCESTWFSSGMEER